MWIKTPDEMYINSDNIIDLEWTRITNPGSGYKHTLVANVRSNSNTATVQAVVQCKTDEQKAAVDEQLMSYLEHGGLYMVPKF